jgi:hypothetical protein
MVNMGVNFVDEIVLKLRQVIPIDILIVIITVNKRLPGKNIFEVG